MRHLWKRNRFGKLCQPRSQQDKARVEAEYRKSKGEDRRDEEDHPRVYELSPQRQGSQGVAETVRIPSLRIGELHHEPIIGRFESRW